jgi:hypothetical protein
MLWISRSDNAAGHCYLPELLSSYAPSQAGERARERRCATQTENSGSPTRDDEETVHGEENSANDRGRSANALRLQVRIARLRVLSLFADFRRAFSLPPLTTLPVQRRRVGLNRTYVSRITAAADCGQCSIQSIPIVFHNYLPYVWLRALLKGEYNYGIRLKVAQSCLHGERGRQGSSMSRFRFLCVTVTPHVAVAPPDVWQNPLPALTEQSLADPEESLHAAMDYVLPLDRNPEVLRHAQRCLLTNIGWLVDEAPAQCPSWAKDELQRAVRGLVEVEAAAANSACRTVH